MRHLHRIAFRLAAALLLSGPAARAAPVSSAAVELTPASTATVSTIYAFPKRYAGNAPDSQLLAVGPALYGTTPTGGAHNQGTVFRVTPRGTHRLLHSFTGADGTSPGGPLAQINGTVYGVAAIGAGHGIVYSIDSAGTFSIVHSFSGGADGGDPNGLTASGGVLYGTTFTSGSGDGVLYSLTPSGIFTTLYTFQNGTDGSRPNPPIVMGDTLVGTTQQGGTANCETSQGCGVIYAVPITGGSETTLHSFVGSDGSTPYGQMLDVNGTLFGTTGLGGAANSGTVFRLSKAGQFKLLHSSQGGPADGYFPYTVTLIESGGLLYGTTTQGGANEDGIIFSIAPTGSYTIVYSFPANAKIPQAGLTRLGSRLYGTTSAGGDCCGTIFALSP